MLKDLGYSRQDGQVKDHGWTSSSPPSGTRGPADTEKLGMMILANHSKRRARLRHRLGLWF